MQNIHNRTRRIIAKRKERDNKAERAQRYAKQQRLQQQRESELRQYA